MVGVLAAGSIEEVAVETLRAGADMFLVCHNQELVWRAYEAVLKEAERASALSLPLGSSKRARISALRIDSVPRDSTVFGSASVFVG